MKWLLCDSPGCVNGVCVCVCVGETASLLTLGVSAEKQIVLLTLRQTISRPPPYNCNWTQLCVSELISVGSLEPAHSLFITAECVCMLKRPLWDGEGLQYTLNPNLWFLIVSFCWVGGFYLAPDALSSQVSTTNSKRHKNHYQQWLLRLRLGYLYLSKVFITLMFGQLLYYCHAVLLNKQEP